MYHNLGRTTNSNVRSVQAHLTEENLLLHGSASMKNNNSTCRPEEERSWASTTERYYRYDGDFEGSDDEGEDVEVRQNTIDLRRAASLEVLKAYGGCFASGFLALQDPLPTRPKSKLRSYEIAEEFDLQRWASEPTSIETASSRSSSNASSPRPDSATLSQADVQDLKQRRKWNWRVTKKSRRDAALKLGL
ncbi:hypothetical protein EJ02DRAFT_412021 [Clathrospora elynae]|uniref:Uncharacterized protein n=1 Tax=Clathrospora elynae TaxID=706981 RepID=A0A6A5SJV1_9PLEO|nr:hypothetical protein EJ02DRAFT_412021 [Clathrospora elynae]